MTGSLTVLGHATVVVELDGQRFITDPILGGRVGHLRRTTAPVSARAIEDIDMILISHIHHDHLDGHSLRRLGKHVPVIAPRGARGILRRSGMTRILELSAGHEVEVGGTRVAAVPAEHHAVRLPWGTPVPALGYVLDRGVRVYFAGDTDRFPGMSAIGDAGVDLALLPVGGWGARLPPGHMDAVAAADALRLLRPATAVPIHWGTLAPAWWRRRTPEARREPALRFAREAALRAPAVDVRILEDGASMRLSSDPGDAGGGERVQAL